MILVSTRMTTTACSSPAALRRKPAGSGSARTWPTGLPGVWPTAMIDRRGGLPDGRQRPIPEGSLAYVDCRLPCTRCGDPTLFFVGDRWRDPAPGPKLIYFDRDYRRLVEDGGEPPLLPEEKSLLLAIARQAVEATAAGFGRSVDLRWTPRPGEPGSSFVTLMKLGALRGCLGSLRAIHCCL
jgi:hypothetical protein